MHKEVFLTSAKKLEGGVPDWPWCHLIIFYRFKILLASATWQRRLLQPHLFRRANGKVGFHNALLIVLVASKARRKIITLLANFYFLYILLNSTVKKYYPSGALIISGLFGGKVSSLFFPSLLCFFARQK